jgi:hypothetical protein
MSRIILNNIIIMSTTVTGAWTPFRTEISKEEIELFKKVTDPLLGAKYSPVAVATQVVNEINYRFFCNSKAVYANAINDASMVFIYKPSEGEPYIISITRA